MATSSSDIKKLSGQSIDGWTIGDVLGEGADGIVYKATREGRDAAIKFYFLSVLEQNGLEESRARLDVQLTLRGAKHHPNLVEIYEGGESKELSTLFLVMELVPGRSLDKVYKDVPRERIPDLARQIAGAAKFLEDGDIAHRDIKPANIMASDDFSHFTLLDLGISMITTMAREERISGEEFVATTRYSPHEFVWRTEDDTNAEAWRAVTFYQIGATLHDVIMRRTIFDGNDKPLARLFDAIKYISPDVETDDCKPWLLTLCKGCLVKNWRERLAVTSWDAFGGPPDEAGAAEDMRRRIRLRQLRNQEKRTADEQLAMGGRKNKRAEALWNLQDAVFLETRRFLMGNSIFPKFRGTPRKENDECYCHIIEFEEDLTLSFPPDVKIEVIWSCMPDSEQATKLRLISTRSGTLIQQGEWTEILSVASAFQIVEGFVTGTVERVIS